MYTGLISIAIFLLAIVPTSVSFSINLQRHSTCFSRSEPFVLRAGKDAEDAPVGDIVGDISTVRKVKSRVASKRKRREKINYDFMKLPAPKLSASEKKALRKATSVLMRNDVNSLTTADATKWFDRSEVWAQVKTYNPILSSYTDAELKRAYFDQGGSLLDFILLAPIGPVLLLVWYFGFSG